jgi:SAM-dependent methyltransferase
VEHSFDLWRDRRVLFGIDVDAYEDGRPGYPDDVYSLLVESCGFGPETAALEVGPGTGQATGRLLDLGATVTAVELSETFASRLSVKYQRRELTVLVGPFESVSLTSSSFDVVVAATSFHWVAPEVGLARAAEMLHPGGWLALWWNYFGDPNRPDPFHEALQSFLREHAPELLDAHGGGVGAGGDGVHPYALDSAARISEIDSTRAYGPVEHHTISWTGRHTAHQLRSLFASFSPWLAIEAVRRETLLDALQVLAVTEFGNLVERPYLTPIYLAQRLPS